MIPKLIAIPRLLSFAKFYSASWVINVGLSFLWLLGILRYLSVTVKTSSFVLCALETGFSFRCVHLIWLAIWATKWSRCCYLLVGTCLSCLYCSSKIIFAISHPMVVQTLPTVSFGVISSHITPLPPCPCKNISTRSANYNSGVTQNIIQCLTWSTNHKIRFYDLIVFSVMMKHCSRNHFELIEIFFLLGKETD